jgi:hypothetical protein
MQLEHLTKFYYMQATTSDSRKNLEVHCCSPIKIKPRSQERGLFFCDLEMMGLEREAFS